MVYSETPPESLTLRDHLARDRTILANERTLLSYFRTGFGFLAGGVTLVKFFPNDPLLVLLGLVLVISGGVVSVLGVVRFAIISARMRSILRQPKKKHESTS